MKTPRKAIILAAGYGERLLPLTLCRPKPLVPAWGKPILRHVIEMFQRWGVRDILVNTHWHADRILDYLRLHPVPGVRIQVSFEPEILGTGGVLPRARWFLDDSPFWMMNADVLADVSPRPFLSAFERHDAIAALWLHPQRGPRTVELTSGLIAQFRSRRPASPGTCTFCGLQLLSPRILAHLPPTGFSSIIDAYERAMAAGERVAGVPTPDAYWADIGTPASYLAAHREICENARRRRPGARLYTPPPRASKPRTCTAAPPAFVSVENDVSIAPRANLCNVVVWNHAIIGPKANIHDAIIADHTVVNGPITYIALPAAAINNADVNEVIHRLGWPVQDTVLNPLPPRGSARTFTRLIHGSHHAILIQYSSERPENALYASHARFLARHGIHVPRVLVDRPEANLCVMEDAGHTSLESMVPHLSPARLRTLYSRVLDQVLILHGAATRSAERRPIELAPAFDRRLFLWEHNLFCEEFLRKHCGFANSLIVAARAELETLVPLLQAAPRVLLHRDLQSSNILIRKGQPVLIDFQGMRFGPAAYDLASLLCDPYVNLPVPLVEDLLAAYSTRVLDGEQRRNEFPVAATQRLAQALGAFGRLGHTPATAGFLRHIPAGVRQFLNAARQTGMLPTLCEALAAWAGRQENTP